MQYSTTAGFLEYLGLGGLEDLPDASELRRIPVQRPVSLLTVDPGLVTVPDALVSLEATRDLGLSLSPSIPAEITKADSPSESVQGSESGESI